MTLISDTILTYLNTCYSSEWWYQEYESWRQCWYCTCGGGTVKHFPFPALLCAQSSILTINCLNQGIEFPECFRPQFEVKLELEKRTHSQRVSSGESRVDRSSDFLSDYNSLSISLLVIFLLLRRSRLEGYILFYNCCLEGLLPWLSLTATTCPPKHRPRPGSPVGIILRYSVWGVFHSFLWINFSKES